MRGIERTLLGLLREPPCPPSAPLGRESLRKLLDLAHAHGLLPIVVDRLTDHTGAAVLADAERLLQQAIADMSVGAGRCMLLSAELERVLAALEAGGIRGVTLKGPDFAQRLYERPQLRPFRDIDVLVAPRDFRTGCEVLVSAGYRPVDSDMKYSRGYGQCGFIGRAGSVELHWNVVNSPTLRKAVSVELDDLQLDDAGRLTPAACLLSACVHAACGHQFDRLQGLCDIARLCAARAGVVDTEYLSDAISKTGAGVAVATALRLAGQMLGEPACEQMRRQLNLREPLRARALMRPTTVLRSTTRAGSLFRQLYRELLKRGNGRRRGSSVAAGEKACEVC
ncbi:MAG: nucleotidyltransferase domain-containing protein [Phycisphaerae bacterium]